MQLATEYRAATTAAFPISRRWARILLETFPSFLRKKKELNFLNNAGTATDRGAA